MKHRAKKTLTLLIALGMLLSLVPALSGTAYADSGSDYTFSIPSSLTVQNVGVNAASNISVTALTANKKLTVSATSTNGWALKSGDNSVGYSMSKTSWEFNAAGSEAFSITVNDYSSKPAGTYTDTVTFTAKVEDAVKVETLLTTLTFGGSSTYSETTSGVVSVTATNVTDYDATFGWLWYNEGSLSVTAKEGYTITKCVFIQNAKTPIKDTEAPFEIHTEGYIITEDTEYSMDGVTSIEVYGYAN